MCSAFAKGVRMDTIKNFATIMHTNHIIKFPLTIESGRRSTEDVVLFQLYVLYGIATSY